ncbi:MAG: adenylate/guanylate cyclase domain-containing protein [Candidatus Limnocylindria bacterium]
MTGAPLSRYCAGVICANCQAESPAGTKFCLDCGSRLGEMCQSCGAARVGDAKFCGECGTPFGEVERGAVTSQAQAHGAQDPVAERRLVSVLFADLVGFTPFAEERDSEDVRETLTRYFDLASEVMTRYGGTVEKFIGDAVMAVWGTPMAQEDDAERSVRAALDLVAAVRELGPGIRARAGVLTGEAAVTLGATNQGMVAGDIVNTAARLQSVAEPGTVLVGESTMRSASAAITFEDAGEHELKGKSGPMAAWRALRVVAERGGRGRSDILEAPFVGRDDELRLLKELFHATGREGRTRLVSVMGPAGIGKSRLGWEFFKYIDGVLEPVWWHTGRSPSYGEGITFWALGEMVRRRAGLAADDDEATTRTRIAETVAEHITDEGERRWIEPALLALLGIGTEIGGSEQLFSAWRTFFERMAETGTVALVFEDLHWADSGTLEFIEHLLEWLRTSPIFIVTLARPELLERRPNWGAGKRNFTSLYLEPLAEGAMGELLSGLVPGLSQAAIRAIVARADGIPLYAVETVRTLIAEGRLSLEGERYVPSGDLATFAVPETLHALIAARLDGLPAEDRTLLTHAAVLGQSFTPQGIVAVTGTTEGELEPRLQDLVRRELLVHIADARSPERGQYAFVQSLIREVAYGMVARRDRKVRHLAAARYFETLPTDEMSGALARHYLAAHENAKAGPEADALGAQARIALKAAAERAMTLGAHAQAVAYLRQALPLTSDPAEEAELLEHAGEAASRAGHHEEAARLTERALDLNRQRDDTEATVRAATSLARVMLEARHMDRALAVLKPMTEAFADLHQPGVAALHGQLARAYGLANDDRTSAEAADRVLEVAEHLDLVSVVADTLITRGTALVQLGRGHEGRGLLSAGLELARKNGLSVTELRATINMGISCIYDDPREALRLDRAGLALTERMGLRDHMLATNAVEVAALAGEWDWADRVIAEHRASDPEGVDRAALFSSAWALQAARGTLTLEDVEAIDDLEAELGDEDSGFLAPLWAQIDFFGGRLKAARATLERLAEGDSLNAPPLLAMAAHAALWDGDIEGVRRILSQFDGIAVRGRLVDANRGAIRAAIEAIAGRRAEALAGYRHVVTELDDMDVRFHLALNAIDMCVALGPDDPEVRTQVDRARATLEELGARPLLDRLEAAVRETPPTAGASTARATEALEVEAPS